MERISPLHHYDEKDLQPRRCDLAAGNVDRLDHLVQAGHRLQVGVLEAVLGHDLDEVRTLNVERSGVLDQLGLGVLSFSLLLGLFLG
jgi:hypothetical protein